MYDYQNTTEGSVFDYSFLMDWRMNAKKCFYMSCRHATLVYIYSLWSVCPNGISIEEPAPKLTTRN